MDTFSREDLRTLLGHGRAPCVSLCMPTTRGPGNADKIHWKNLVHEAEERLAEAGHRRSEAHDLLEPARRLLEQAAFWLEASAGLAGFYAAGLDRTYRLPISLAERVVVGGTFDIKPLLPLISGDGRFFLLAFAKKSVRLFSGTRYTMAEIELTDVPADLVEAMQVEDASRSRTLHTHTAPGGTMRNREGIAHSYGVGVTGRKEGVREFLEQIDRGIHKHLADQEAPLVLAGVDYLLAMFREVTSYRHVLGEGIAGNPQGLSEKQLHDRAWVLVEPHFQRERERVLGLLGQVAGTGQCGLPLEEVVKAAFQGRIQYLLVVPEAERWGTIDPAALNVEVHERRQPGDEDLVNLALAHALRHKTKAFAVEANQLPEGAAVAAVYWLPIGERRDKRVLASGP